MSQAHTPKSVRCPPHFAPLFEAADGLLSGLFGEFERHPEQGEIRVSGARYLLMRTDSLAIELHAELRKTFGEAAARQIRYKLARACGKRDAAALHKQLGIDDVDMKAALGPVQFAYVGWAFVNLSPESQLQPNEDCLAIYDHPYSFEAASYVDNGIVASQPVCLMNAGYSAGWVEASYGIAVEAEELTCRAQGDDECMFVMAHPKHLARRVAEHRAKLGLG
jgi:uncharacterized protein